jgi:hypothetical protein
VNCSKPAAASSAARSNCVQPPDPNDHAAAPGAGAAARTVRA